jgi:hypothetical protein
MPVSFWTALDVRLSGQALHLLKDITRSEGILPWISGAASAFVQQRLHTLRAKLEEGLTESTARKQQSNSRGFNCFSGIHWTYTYMSKFENLQDSVHLYAKP